MASSLDMVYRPSGRTDREYSVSEELSTETQSWLVSHGIEPINLRTWREALTHGSTSEDFDYERLEFLGDRVLGLSIAHWLYKHNDAKEGRMAQRLNALVSKGTCAQIARDIGAGDHIRLGKQAHDDGTADSDNVLGDIIESMIAAHYLDHGFDATCILIHNLWNSALEGETGVRKHPKSALQEWAAENKRRPPEYTLIDRSGPDHRARFTVKVSVHGIGEAEATAESKRSAEKAAALTFMETYG